MRKECRDMRSCFQGVYISISPDSGPKFMLGMYRISNYRETPTLKSRKSATCPCAFSAMPKARRREVRNTSP